MGPLALHERRVIPELMDAPDVDQTAHTVALVGLERINRISRTATLMAGPIAAMARRRNLRRLTLLDIACGGGDVPLAVARALRSRGIDAELTLSDRSSIALG